MSVLIVNEIRTIVSEIISQSYTKRPGFEGLKPRGAERLIPAFFSSRFTIELYDSEGAPLDREGFPIQGPTR
jgi:hypothetical protein